MKGSTPPSARLRWRLCRGFPVLLATLFLPLLAHGAAIRRDFYFNAIGAERGLAQNTVYAFLQDRAGFIWLATGNGVQQFNGYDFTSYEYSGDRSDRPPEGSASALAEDADGNLWIGTSAFGLVRHDQASGVFEHMSVAGGSPGTLNVQALLYVAHQGLWVGSKAGLSLIDTSDGHVLRTLTLTAGDQSDLQIRRLCLGDDGSLWLASSAGLFHLAPDASALERVAADRIDDARDLLLTHDGHLHVAAASGLYQIQSDGVATRIWPLDSARAISAMTEDARGRLWLAIPQQGLTILDPANGQAQALEPDNRVPGGLPDAVVLNLQVDRSGLLWIGTLERGVIKVDPDGTPFRYVADHDPQREQTASNYIRATFEDRAGRLWIGTLGDGLKRYDTQRNQFEYYGDVLAKAAHAGNQVVVVSALANAGDDKLWLATNHGVALFDPARRSATFLPQDPSGASGLADTDIRSLLLASNGTLWLGTAHQGLVQHDPTTRTWHTYRQDAAPGASGGLSDDRVLALHEDRQGRIWAGNRTGLNLIDPVQRSVRVFRNDPDDAHSLSENVVRSLHESADGTLWIGTQGGLNRLDSLDMQHARFTRWLTRDDLPSGTVYAIADDKMGRLWLSTNRGIATFDRATGTFHPFTLADGLQGMEYNSGASALLDNGDFVFGGVNGLNLFSPQAIVGSRYPAPVVFTSVHVGNGERSILQDSHELNMAMADRVIRFEFAALDFTAPERNRFAYQLEGFDDHWIEADTRRDATYTNLDAGRYTFKVRGSNHDGFWNERVAAIGLRVTPPWWQSGLAKSLYLFFASLTLLLWWRAYRLRRSAERTHHHDLREREDRLRLALWGSGDDFWDWNILRGEFVVTGSSDLFKGVSKQPVIYPYDWFREHLHGDDRAAVERRLEQHFNGATATFESEHRLRNRKGDWVWSLARGRIVEHDEDGQPRRMCGTARDVTAEREAEHDRRIAQEVIRSMSEAVAVTDLEFRFLSVNPAFTKIAGWRNDEVTGRPADLLNCAQHPAEHYMALRESLARSGHWRGELWQRRKDGDEFLSWSEISEVRDASGIRTHFVSVISDITDRKRTEQELRYLANYDALTGLPNRTLLSERIGHAIIRAQRGGRRVAVLFLDLDRFKHVNDSMGHAAGDRMLKAAGSRLRQVVREGDSVARLGGDEFTVVLEDIAGSIDAERIAEKIIAAFEQPLELDTGQEVVISPSIGISLYPDHGQLPTDLLKFADTAMYQAKDHGRKTYMVYTEAMDAAARLRATTVAALRKALERHEFSLVYQPKQSLLDERITGVEALLRWRSRDLGNVSPGVFIPIAEETGLIIEIGDWVVAQACAQLAQWRDAGVRDISMSINVSVAQLLRGDLIQRLCDVLAAHDIAPHLIELELTESMVMANAEQSITTLRRLKAIGVTLAIDDFGTGYSSLSYLKRLPIDTLKIDKEFVGDLTTDPDDEAITATVITMAHTLGLNVVAEGVERLEQVEYLREQDCDEIQGHWLSLPLPPEQCLAFLRERAGQRQLLLGEQE